jgi:dolichyl-phosphate-mannose--protein O-mannosyl transferase
MIDIFPVFFILCAYLLFMVHMQARTADGAMVTLVALGVVLGIGIAAKWIVLAAWASIVFFLLLRLVLHAFDVDWLRLTPGLPVAPYLVLGVVALAIVPAVIYLASWYPFFARGQFHNLADLVNYQIESYRYHATLRATHPYGSPPWSWPFLARPVLYYAEYYPYLGIDQFTGGQLQARMINLGNPWIWWTSLPCVASMPYFVIRHRSFVAAVILLGFITQYAPWFPVTRVLFMYHMFGGLIFMVLAVAFVLTYLAEQLRRPGGEYLVAGYLAVTVLFFGYFYPVWTAVPLSNAAWSIQPGTPVWGPKLWLVNCRPNLPPSQPQLFCWN